MPSDQKLEPLLQPTRPKTVSLKEPKPMSPEEADEMDTGSDPSIFRGVNRGRVAIFIDGANLFYSALQMGIEINYSRMLQCLVGESRLLRAYFYTGVDRTNEKQQNFLLWMRRNGYRVVTKDLVQFPDGSRKADLAVEIAVDMMKLVGSYDTAVLVSGDGDLTYAVNAIGYQGVRVELVSLRSMTSDQLINVSDCYVNLADIQSIVAKQPESCVSALNN